MSSSRCLLLVLALAVSMTAAGVASAKDVYVAPWGIDGPPNTGLSIADPFLTISFSLSAGSGLPLVAGDRILVLPGVYGPGELFPIQLPVGVSLIGVGGATATTIAAPGVAASAVEVFGANTPDTAVSGFTISGSIVFGGAIEVTGGPGYFWPTSPPLPAPPAGPGVASPTIADNIMAGNAHGVWAYANYGPTSARVERNLMYGNYNGGVASVSSAYAETSIFDNNILAPAFAGAYFVGFGGPVVYPLFRSNVVYGSYFGSAQLPFGSTTFADQANSTTVGNFVGHYDVYSFPYYGYDAFIDSIVYYNTYDVYSTNSIGMWFSDYSGISGGGINFGIGSINAPPALGGAGFALTSASPCIDQGINNIFVAHGPTGESWYSSYDVYGDARIVNVVGIPSAYYGTDVAQIDMGADEYNDGPDCLGGTVNTGGPCGGATGTGPVDTVFVNGSSGGNGRTVVASTGSGIAVSLTLPPAGAPFPTKYIVNGWAGAPAGVGGTAWPKSVGSGCFTIFPATFVANTAKPSFSPSTPEATLCTQPCVVLDIPPGLPIGSVWTFQGITTDNGGPGSAAGGAICAAVTNGVVTVVGP